MFVFKLQLLLYCISLVAAVVVAAAAADDDDSDCGSICIVIGGDILFVFKFFYKKTNNIRMFKLMV